jgi:ribosomal-protein-alanine N-acetyltransferase
MWAEDIPELILLDREAFPPGWPPNPFKRELGDEKALHLVALPDRERPSTSERRRAGILGRIADGVADLVVGSRAQPEVSRNIAGYIALMMMEEEAHVTSLAVRPLYRLRGVGELLLISAIDLAADHGAAVLTLEVRTSNFPAQALYEKYGFRRVGERRHYYSDNRESPFGIPNLLK